MISVNDCIDIINLLLPEPHAGLLAGMLFGVKAQLSPELKQALINTGTIHITALSGMNITILVSLFVTTLLPITGRRIASLLTIVIIIGFILFVGVSPSVVRAGIMGSLSLLAIVFGRQQKVLFFLGLTVLLMILFYPPYLTDISFQLSVGATLGIVLFAKHPKELHKLPPQNDLKNVPVQDVPKQHSYIPRIVREDLHTTLSAQVFTLPIIALSMHQVSLISPLANVLIGIVIAPLTVIGLCMVVFAFFVFPLAQLISWFVWLLLSYLIIVVQILSQFPYASIQW